MPVSMDVVKEKYLVDFSILLCAKENFEPQNEE